MHNLASSHHPSLGTDSSFRGFGAWRWLRQQLRYHRAMRELNSLESSMLDDIGIAPDQFPALARRHARGLPPLELGAAR